MKKTLVLVGIILLLLCACKTTTELKETSRLVTATRLKTHSVDGWSLTFESGLVCYVRVENIEGELRVGSIYQLYQKQAWHGKQTFDKPWWFIRRTK